MRAGVIIAVVLAIGACKSKAADPSSTPNGAAPAGGSSGSGSGSAAKPPAKGDAEVAAALKVLVTVTPPIAAHKNDCPAMKAAFDPVLASLQAESKQVLDGIKDPDIKKRIDEINIKGTALYRAWSDTAPALVCPEVSDTLARALGQL